MDPGLQLYGGSLFKELNLEGGKIFVTIPEPLPSRRRSPSFLSSVSSSSSSSSYSSSSYSSSTSALAPPVLPQPQPQVHLQDYYAGSGGGCFGAACTVIKLSHGKEIATPLATLRKGDQVKVMNEQGQESFASILFLVKIQRPQDRPLLRLSSSGLVITSKHPIRVHDTWRLPSSLPSATKLSSHDGWVYNVILDQGHILLVNGIECITWGHNLQKDDVVRHPFYGSELVVKNIQVLEEQQHADEVVEVRGTWQDHHGQVVGLW